ncbi:MAG: alpha/beta fold hydrolase, partial [Alicyclobacillus sp.]|nr:alpha/beta fold hydrolase [Alicyclobacillus sp.]
MTTASVPDSLVTVRDVRMEWYRRGTGDPVLVLHGVKDPMGWQAFHEQLSKDFDVMVPMHPGFGRSDRPKWLESIEDLAYVYLDLLNDQDLHQVHLLGMDVGGWIALEMCVRCTHRIRSLTLVDSVGIKVSGPEIRDIVDLNTMSYEDMLQHLWFDPERGKLLMASPYEMSDEELSIYLRNQESEVLYTWHPFMHNPNLRKWLHRINVPTLVLWGEADRVVSLNYAQALADSI